MGDDPQERQATRRRFRIEINGRLSDGFADALDGIDQQTVGGSTVLTGILVDKATLHGVLDYLRRLGIDIEGFETSRDTDSSPKTQRPMEGES